MKRILFVCVHNAGRSPMAEAFFNVLARQRELEAVAESAGTAPGAGTHPAAARAMAEVGVGLDRHRTRLLTPEIAAQADRIIPMGCGVDPRLIAAGTVLSEDWDFPDLAGQPLDRVREIRDAVRERVESLLRQLAEEEAGPEG